MHITSKEDGRGSCNSLKHCSDNSHFNIQDISKQENRAYGHQAFAVAGPTAWNSLSVIRHLALTVSDVCLKLGCFRSTSTYNALEVLHFMRYINSRLTTYLITNKKVKNIQERTQTLQTFGAWMSPDSTQFFLFAILLVLLLDVPSYQLQMVTTLDQQHCLVKITDNRQTETHTGTQLQHTKLQL